MSSKKWCITFLFSVILIVILYASFNMIVDPFGVFGDVLFDWYSYDMTNNPRVAKIGYLDKNENYKKYDSYVIGCSSTSSFSAKDLNEYMGGNWYNMIMYGADMLDVEQTCRYVIDEYDAKNIMINIFISNATKYDVEEDPITKNMHAKLNEENKIKFYGKYLFLNPQYAIAKIKASKTDTYLTQPFDVFNVETGAYDKKVRDVEPISTLEKYYEAYPVFANYPHEDIEMTEIDTTVASVKRIKEYCEEKGVKVTFVMASVYSEYLKYFREEQVKEYYTKIAEVTDYWDFTTSALTSEPRFFYDETHFRNALGKMAIVKMAEEYGNKRVYYLKDIGEYVTKENVEEHLQKLWEFTGVTEKEGLQKVRYTKNVPIITYHSLVTNPSSNSEISPEMFEKQIKALKDNGYTGVMFEQLVDYVYYGEELPNKPVCITFDDGYLNNYEIAYPILKKYDMKATIFVIGSSVGSLTNYKDTEYPITPHFTYEQAKEMIDTGIISVQSHTYDMHQWKPYEVGRVTARENILQLENESETKYMQALAEDTVKMAEEIKEKLKQEVVALAYPSGMYETLTNVVLKENGIKATVTINEGNNEIIKGLPQSLYALNRYNMDETVTVAEMLEKIEK